MGSFFSAPWMLGWLAAIAVPILIHLFARQRYKQVAWAAMELLQRAFKKTQRRIRLEHLLLLLLRILAILLLVLALADPILEGGGIGGIGGGRREVVILIDDSYSTGLTGPDGTSEFTRIQTQARELVQDLRRERGDSVTIVRTSRPASLVLKATPDLDEAIEAIDDLTPSDLPTDLVGAFETSWALLQDLEKGAEVWLLSDLQRSAFVPGGGDEEDGAAGNPGQVIASRLTEMRDARGAGTTFVLPRQIPTDNLAITAIELRSKAVIAGNPTHFSVAITNHASEPRGGRVDIFVDGASDAADFRELDAVPPGETIVVDVFQSFRTPGSHFIEARFLSDNLDTDNRRRIAVEARARIDALVVDGDPGTEPGDQESFFLAAALDPGADEAGQTAVFAVEVQDETRFQRADLSEKDLLVLMDVALVSRDRAEDIERFVRDGGGLLVFLGDKTKPETLNQLLWRGGRGVLPAEIGQALAETSADREVAWRMRVDRFDHPVLAYFEDEAIRPWLTELPPFMRFFRTKVGEDTRDVRVLAEFESEAAEVVGREPALIEKRFGDGRSILFTSSGNREWTDLPALPSYPILVSELAYWLTRREHRLENLLVGARYRRVLSGVAQTAALSLDGEALEELAILSPEGTERFELVTNDDSLGRAGVYRLDLQGRTASDSRDPSPIHLAVNVDTTESNLTRVDRAWLTNQYGQTGLRIVDDVSENEDGEGLTDDRSTWWWLLMLAGLLFAAETVLSQIFGSRQQGAAAS